MTVRRLLSALAGFALLAGLPAVEAQPRATPRIGWLLYGGPFSDTSPGVEAAVLQALRARGWIEGKTVVIEYRYAEGRPERLPELAAELVRLRVDLLLALGGDVALPLARTTSSIPIVVASSADPVRSQLVTSLARPGGNVTGVTFLFDELAAKRVELLKEAVPAIGRIGVLWDPTHLDNDTQETDAAARRLNLQLVSLPVREPGELDAALRLATQERVEALSVVPGRLTALLGRRITDWGASQRVPVVSGWKVFAQAGALLTYGPNTVESAKRTAVYVDRILKGARPGDLPVERPTTFELVINLRAARALGLTIPASLLERADQVLDP